MNIGDIGLIKSFLAQATIKGVRTTILRPIAWMIAILLSAILITVFLQSPVWLQVMLAIFLCFTMLLYLFSYLFCLFTDKDALRSEKYSISKLAIEKGLYGDNVSGTIKMPTSIAGAIEDYTTSRSEEEE